MIARLLHHIERIIMARRAYKWVMRDWVQLDSLGAASNVLRTMRFTRNLRPQLLPPPKGRLLVIAPHPDDEVIGPGGTLMMACESGAQVSVFFLSSGNPAEARVRQGEAIAVTTKLGWESFFRKSEYSEAPDRSLREVIAECRPDKVFVPFLLDDHAEHRSANYDVLDAFDSLDGEADRSIEVWAYQVYSVVIPNVIVDISDIIDRKSAAIEQYQSQGKNRDWSHFARGMAAFNSRLKPGAGQAYVETFFVVPLHEYLALCRTYRDELLADRSE